MGRAGKIARRSFLIGTAAIAGGVAFGTYLAKRPTDNPLEEGLAEGEAKTASQDDSVARPWCCSTEAEKARCGINRIWVLTSDRRRGTASRLLDCVR